MFQHQNYLPIYPLRHTNTETLNKNVPTHPISTVKRLDQEASLPPVHLKSKIRYGQLCINTTYTVHMHLS